MTRLSSMQMPLKVLWQPGMIQELENMCRANYGTELFQVCIIMLKDLQLFIHSYIYASINSAVSILLYAQIIVLVISSKKSKHI